MDPRHPENAIWRMRQLMEQFQFVLNKLNAETVSSKLGEAEREGALVVQEICLVAPRLHEAMMQTSRQRRHDLARGFYPEVSAEALSQPTKETIESYTAPNQAETVIVEPKPRKKSTKKKKTAKKAE